jgi:hypothetical protein
MTIEPKPCDNKLPKAAESKTTGPHPWLPIGISVAALLVALLSLGVNYFRASDPPNTIIVTAEVKKQIGSYFVEADDFYIRTILLRRDVSPQEFQKLDSQIDDWSRRMGDYLQEKLGAAEKGRMLDITGITPFHADGAYPPPISEERSKLLFALAITKKNLALLIDRLKVR